MAAASRDSTGHRRTVQNQLTAFRHNLRIEGPQVVRIVVAVAVSWQVCVWLGAVNPPVFAVVVPLVAMRDAPESAFNVSLARLVGVVGGLVLGMLVLSWLQPSAVAVALVIAVGLVVGIVLRIGGVLNTQIAISALMLFANADPSSYALARLWETAVGAAVTVVLSPLLLPTNPARAFRRALRDVATTSGRPWCSRPICCPPSRTPPAAPITGATSWRHV